MDSLRRSRGLEAIRFRYALDDTCDDATGDSVFEERTETDVKTFPSCPSSSDIVGVWYESSSLFINLFGSCDGEGARFRWSLSSSSELEMAEWKDVFPEDVLDREEDLLQVVTVVAFVNGNCAGALCTRSIWGLDDA